MDSLCVDTAVPKKNSIWIFTYSHFFAHLLPAFVDKKNIVLGNQLIILLQFCHPNYTSIQLVKPTNHSSNPVPSNSNQIIRIKETKRPNQPVYILNTDQPVIQSCAIQPQSNYSYKGNQTSKSPNLYIAHWPTSQPFWNSTTSATTTNPPLK